MSLFADDPKLPKKSKAKKSKPPPPKKIIPKSNAEQEIESAIKVFKEQGMV